MKVVLQGRVVTMDAAFTVLPAGAVYIDRGAIVAVTAQGAPAPAGVAGATSVDTGGTIFPGLIELHNHLSYDALPMWKVPKKFTNRGQWQGNADYASRVSGPMGVIAKSSDPHVLAALARYVETKCLLGGVTTSQGISLQIATMDASYHGAMRVVDDPVGAGFPKATTHILDVVAKKWSSFNKVLGKASCLLLHLSEGLDAPARDAFLSLQNGSQWAITPALAGIHCAALQAADFAVMAQHGGSMVWSPFSNLMLYGGTSDIVAARAAGVPIALGSDWSPTGSKNLLNELKVAHAASAALNLGLTDRDIVAMATRVPAAIVKWGHQVGSIEAGKRADLTVVGGAGGDAYAAIIGARETDVVLVLIDGRPVVGTQVLMSALGATGETLSVGGQVRIVDYGPGDPNVPFLTWSQAKMALAEAFGKIPTLLQGERAGRGVFRTTLAAAPPRVRLALDEEHMTGFSLRPSLPLHGQLTGPDALVTTASTHKKPALKPVTLDPPTVVDDPNYAANIRAQANISAAVQAALLAFYP